MNIRRWNPTETLDNSAYILKVFYRLGNHLLFLWEIWVLKRHSEWNTREPDFSIYMFCDQERD